MRVLDLFSGIGGFSLGLERAGMTTAAFCEIDPFCRKVLKKHWPSIPCYEDITKLTAEQLKQDGIEVDLICGGFPCQDISIANQNGKGLHGERSGLWHEYARLIGEVRPRYIIIENVTNLTRRGLADILRDLASLGYDAEWHCIPASALGAAHRRDRVWIIACPDSLGRSGRDRESPIFEQSLGAYIKKGCSLWPETSVRIANHIRHPETAPDYLRSDYGLSDWVHRIRALGNAVVPQIPKIIGKVIMEAENEQN